MKAILTTFVLFTFFSCSSTDDLSDKNPEDSIDEQFIDVEYTTISTGNLYGAGEEGIEQQNIVINDSTNWNSLLYQIDLVNNETSNFTETKIDFTLYQIIAVFDSIRPTDGYSIDLNISRDEEKIIVDLSILEPGEIVGGDVITQPYHIVKLASSGLPIEFH